MDFPPTVYDPDFSKAFNKRHTVEGWNGHTKRRRIIAEIVAVLGERYVRFSHVCPMETFTIAKELHDEGWLVTGIYAYYSPVGGCLYDEGFWINSVTEAMRFLTNETVSCHKRCKCGVSHK